MASELLVGFESALSFWRSARMARPGEKASSDLESGGVFGTGGKTVVELARTALGICCCEAPIDAVLLPGGKRHNCPLIKDHHWAGPTNEKMLFRADKRIAVFRMPAVIVQLARIWDEIDVATVAMEMLGTYGISNQEDFSWAVDLQPLVTMGELQDYARVASASGVRGAKRAQEAIKLSVPNSNSPRETAVALYLGLPRRKGWAELGGFVMNQGIRLAEEQERIAGQGVVKPDFLWESKSVSVEYDSDLEHLTPQQKTKDERRRNAMESAGYWAPTLTNGIVKDEDALNAFTAELERRMGFRRRALTRAESERRHDLVRRLFVKDF